jgi:ribosome-binding factor A
MAQGNRPERVGEEILQELGTLLVREVKDPGVGFVTLTRAKVSPDLQLVRIYYTSIGDEKARRETQKALERATPFLRRQIGSRVRLRRVPELRFEFDKSVEHQDRIERILLDLEAERKARAADSADASGGEPPSSGTSEPDSADAAPPDEKQS